MDTTSYGNGGGSSSFKQRISLNDYVSLRAKSSSHPIKLESTSRSESPSIAIKQEPSIAETAPPLPPADAAVVATLPTAEPQVIKEEPQLPHLPSPKRVNKKLPTLSLIDELKKRMKDDKVNKENNDYLNNNDADDDDNDDKTSPHQKSKRKHRSKSKKQHHHRSKSSKKSHKSKKNKKSEDNSSTDNSSGSTSSHSTSEAESDHHHHHRHHNHNHNHHHKNKKKLNFSS
jgi:hypothetical protein